MPDPLIIQAALDDLLAEHDQTARDYGKLIVAAATVVTVVNAHPLRVDLSIIHAVRRLQELIE